MRARNLCNFYSVIVTLVFLTLLLSFSASQTHEKKRDQNSTPTTLTSTAGAHSHSKKEIQYALIDAIEANESFLLKKILQQDASFVDLALNDNNDTPLLLAIARAHPRISFELLNAGASPKLTNKYGVTPLMQASILGKTAIVKALCELGVDLNSFDTYAKTTALILASQIGYVDIVKILVEAGASVDLKHGEGGFSALHAALFTPTFFQNGEAKSADDEFMSDLMRAQQKNNKDIYEIMEALLQAGADPNLPTEDGLTVLYTAAMMGQKESVDVLINFNAQINPTTRLGFTPLMVASLMGHEEIMETLLKHGAKVNAQCKNGLTALILSLLDPEDINLNKTNKNTNTPESGVFRFTSSIMNENSKSVEGVIELSKLLLKYNARVDLKTTHGITALILAESKAQLRSEYQPVAQFFQFQEQKSQNKN